MIYDDAQVANLLARVTIGFTSVGIEAITTEMETELKDDNSFKLHFKVG